MQPIPSANTTKSIITVIAGLVLSLAVLVIHFLAPVTISDSLAALLITAIGMIAGAFNINIVSSQDQTIAAMSVKLSNAGIQH